MKILLVSQHYRPEPINSTEIAEGLAERGHELWALVGQPNYPSGTVYPGYDARQLMQEDINSVHVVRCPLHPRKTGVVHRVWNYYSFSRSGQRVQAQLPDDFDVVLSYQTSPVMMANPAIAYARRTGVPLLLYCLDIWPECLTVGGIRPGSIVYNHYKKVARKIYGEADLLAVTSPLFERYLREVVGVQFGQALYLPHFAPDEFGMASGKGAPGYNPSKINLTYAGNVGVAQSVDTVIRAAALLCDDERFAFHVLGSGTELDACKKLAVSLGTNNLTFHGQLPYSSMPDYYEASDAMLFTFAKNDLLSYTVPFKLHTYFASGRPVLCAADGDSRRVIEEAQAGLCVSACDARGLADACVELFESSQASQMGSNARAYFEAHFTREHFFDTLEGALNRLKGTEHGCRN